MKSMAMRQSSLRVPAGCRPGNETKTYRANTIIVEEYVEGVYRLQQDVPKVSTGEVAEYMCVSPGSATTMVKHLHELGFVNHEPYQGLTLTELGRNLAERLVHAHRVLDVFLVERAGMDWSEVHELACRLEHHFSDEQIAHIAKLLGDPEACPHGNPIPLGNGKADMLLEECEVDVPLKVSRITDERPDFLQYLRSIGLVPGAQLSIAERSGVDSVIHLQTDQGRVTVGTEVGWHVRVSPI